MTEKTRKLEMAFSEMGWKVGDDVPHNELRDKVGAPHCDDTVCLRDLERLPRKAMEERIEELQVKYGFSNQKPKSDDQKLAETLLETLKDLEAKARKLSNEHIEVTSASGEADRLEKLVRESSYLRGKLAMLQLVETNVQDLLEKMNSNRQIHES